MRSTTSPARRVAFGIAALVALAPFRAVASSQEPAIRLWQARAPDARGDSIVDQPSITPFLPPAGKSNGTAIVIFPGGGYQHLAFDKEGADVARWLNGLGVSAFVVTYRLGPRYQHPAMLHDAQRAVRLVRAGAERWGLNAQRVGVMGFSAGGHMAATAGTHFEPGAPMNPDAIERVSSRPDFMVLLYPVITMDDHWAHHGSRVNLLGGSPSDALVHLMSNETQVTAQTPPAFIVATTDDATVPVRNSVMFYDALEAAKVPAELHIFESGRHGFGLAPADPVLSTWLSLCEAWMRRHGWVH